MSETAYSAPFSLTLKEMRETNLKTGNRFKKVTDLLLYPIQKTVIYICACKLFM